MKVKIRRSCQDDLESVYKLHCKCFSQTDQWYKSAIKPHLDKGIIVELIEENKLIGVLLQGTIVPCNTNILDIDNNYQDIFEPLTDNGKLFLKNKLHFKDLYGIVMLCIDPEYQKKGLATKLIEKHFKDNKNKLICLNTRMSNISAYSLYQKMGYEHIANIKNKYFLPTEDSSFMIKNL
jgi:ribosomal protein S18 acetylase RimI-like enzyme